MMYGFVLVVHVLVALFLIAVILLQGGRGGLGETMGGAAAQSLFGGGANTVMTKLTSIVAALFMVTCLALAILSTQRGRSVLDQFPVTPEQLPGVLPQPATPATEPGTPAKAGVGDGSAETRSVRPTEPGTAPQPGSATEVPNAAGGGTTTAPQ